MEFEDFKNIVEQEKYTRNEITFSVYATFVDNRYWGWFFCEECKANEPSNHPEETIERAILSAKTTANAHYSFNHREK